MKRSKNYNLRLPERGARTGEANDPADIEDLTYDLEILDEELQRQADEAARLEQDKATKQALAQHAGAALLDHPDGSVTDAKLGQRTVLTTAGTLQALLTGIGNAILAATGASAWDAAPATTLKAAAAHQANAQLHVAYSAAAPKGPGDAHPGSAATVARSDHVHPGHSPMAGATPAAAGEAGLVPAPDAGAQDKFLRGDGAWAEAAGAIPDSVIDAVLAS